MCVHRSMCTCIDAQSSHCMALYGLSTCCMLSRKINRGLRLSCWQNTMCCAKFVFSTSSQPTTWCNIVSSFHVDASERKREADCVTTSAYVFPDRTFVNSHVILILQILTRLAPRLRSGTQIMQNMWIWNANFQTRSSVSLIISKLRAKYRCSALGYAPPFKSPK